MAELKRNEYYDTRDDRRWQQRGGGRRGGLANKDKVPGIRFETLH
jgi:hypothetical protein